MSGSLVRTCGVMAPSSELPACITIFPRPNLRPMLQSANRARCPANAHAQSKPLLTPIGAIQRIVHHMLHVQVAQRSLSGRTVSPLHFRRVVLETYSCFACVCATTAITLSRVRATQELPVNHHHREPPTNHPGATLSMVSTGCDLRCLVKKRCWVGMDPLPL